MSNETHDDAEQLFDSEIDEVAADNATDTNENLTDEEDLYDNSDSEQEHNDDLDLDEEDKVPSKAEEAKLQQIKKWQDAIDNGSKSIKDLPKAQSWLKKYLKFEDNSKKVQESEKDFKTIAKELMEEERQEAQFADLKFTLNNIRLTPEQKAVIKDKFQFFATKGIPKHEALTLAAEYAKVDFSGLSERKRRMAIPKPSTKSHKGEIDWDRPFSELVESVPQDKINEHLRSLVR